jgi:tetratricopeptide (TPR) repeat protein
MLPAMKGRFFAISLLLLLSGCVSQTNEGIRYYGQARYDAAMTAFQSALKTNPNDPNTLYNIAATYHQSAKVSLLSGQAATALQHYEQASQYYQLCLAQANPHADAYRGLAALYMDRRNPEAAFQLLNNWYSAQPVSAEPKLELARLHQEYAQICMIQGETEVAQYCRNATAQLLQQVLATEPTNYRALRALGYFKEQSGDIAGAVAEYQRSLQSYPGQKDLEERIAALNR